MNIAFAGFRHGHILVLYNTALENKNTNIIGCYEEDVEERKKVNELHGIKFNYSSYEEILNDKNVEAVAIGDYYGKRGKMIIEALNKGKHVICDKPLCTSLEELDEIERLANQKKLTVCCMLDLRYMPQASTAREIITSGKIGKVYNISFTGQHCLNYGVRPGWYFEEGKHGGTINDIAIHGIDLVRFITGKNLTKVNCAKVWNAFANKEPQFKDCGQFMAEMGEISVMADISYAAPKFNGTMPTYWDFYFWGTEGMLKFNLADSNLYIYKEEQEIVECKTIDSDMINDFINEINGEKTIIDSKDILKSQRQVLKIQKEADKGAI